jgi:hypothetical protein
MGTISMLPYAGPIEVVGDMFALMSDFDAVGIPTNGDYNKFGDAVMGRGVAAAARSRWPILAEFLGAALARYGNHVHFFENDVEPKPKFIFSFPTKHHARDRNSDPVLIERSCKELMSAIASKNLTRVLLPRPGCGCGGLDWAQVKRILGPVLDRRVHVCELAD